MDKVDPSSWHYPNLFHRCVLWVGFLLVLSANLSAVDLSNAEAKRIGKKIWQNECGGTVSGLTSWNEGENFASLGIGHFIWYPADARGPFDEKFPTLLRYIKESGGDVPAWLQNARACPWNSRAEFLREQDSPRMKELRDFLLRTVDLQTKFLVNRLEQALPKMLEEAAPANRDRVRQHFQQLSRSSPGCYALIDYVNFKGEGVLHSERYHDQGWGLLQVLEEMKSGAPDPVREFSHCVGVVLSRRVRNSPPQRNEARWLPGWLHRVNDYSRA